MSNTQLLTGLVDGQSYVVTETSANAAGFSLTGLVCTGGGADTTVESRGGVATIGFDAGENIVCTYTNSQVLWDLTKVSDPPTGSVVDPGDTITYTVTATNTGFAPLTDLTVIDDLTDVLDNAALVTESVTASVGTVAVSGTTLTWTIPLLSGTATVTYKVTVNADAFNASLFNVVTGSGDGTTVTSPPPENCAGEESPPTAEAAEAPSAVLAAAETAVCATAHQTGFRPRRRPAPRSIPGTPTSSGSPVSRPGTSSDSACCCSHSVLRPWRGVASCCTELRPYRAFVVD